MNTNYIPNSAMLHMNSNNWSQSEMKDFGVIAKHFYDDLHTYMSNWTNWITPLTSFSWSNLKSQIHLDSVVTSAVEINKMQSNQQIQIDNLTEQVQRINAYLDDNIVVWN